MHNPIYFSTFVRSLKSIGANLWQRANKSDAQRRLDTLLFSRFKFRQSDGNGDFPYIFNAAYSPSGRLGNKFTSAKPFATDVLFGYDRQRMTHQPRTLFAPYVGTLELYWDANGNLAQMIGCKQNSGRLHEWDEENRLRFVLGERFAGYYGYDANGERVYL